MNDKIIIEPTIRDIRHLNGGVEIDISIPPELFYFRGHFPIRPILPGVVQIDWAVQLADQHLGTNIKSAQKFNVKFKSIVEPPAFLKVVLTQPPESDRVTFEYRDGDSVLSSGSISMREF